MADISGIVRTNDLNDKEKLFLEGLYALGQNIAYHNYRHVTDTPYDIYCERYVSTKYFDGVNNERIYEIMRRGKVVYEKGFANFNGKTYVDKLNDIRRNHLGVHI